VGSPEPGFRGFSWALFALDVVLFVPRLVKIGIHLLR
jgi:hypothetical protein